LCRISDKIQKQGPRTVYRSVRYTCTRVTTACRTHAYSRGTKVPHPRVRRIYTRTQQPPCAVPSCGREREREREREEGERQRERKRQKQTEAWEKEGERERERDRENAGRCTWKLCGAVKPRRLLFTICRDHTKFIRRDHTTPIDT